MNSEYESIRLRELCLRITKGTTPTKGVGFVKLGINYIKSESITSDGSIDVSKFAFIDLETHRKLVRSQLCENNVLFSMAGVYLGKTAVVLPKHLPANTNQAVGIITLDESKADPYFIHYSLQSPGCRAWVLRSASQSAQPNFNLQEIGDLKVPALSLEGQKEIASVLRLFDDRITLLRETNASLEAIAQTLFKSWFVDFDPVRAKLEGRAPEGMDEATATLFPDSFDESELGLVPRGWRVTTLADTFEINPTRKLTKGLMASYLDMASLATSGHCVDAPIEREMGSGAKFQNGDTLLARITPCLENGKSAFVDFLADGQIGWGSTEFLVLRPKAPLPQYLGYLLCRQPAFREFAIQSMSGTSGRQRIQNDVLGRYLLAVPGLEIATVFAGVIEPIQRSIAANHQSAQTLVTLRDTLLPRLISGQLRLPDIEAAQEAT